MESFCQTKSFKALLGFKVVSSTLKTQVSRMSKSLGKNRLKTLDHKTGKDGLTMIQYLAIFANHGMNTV